MPPQGGRQQSGFFSTLIKVISTILFFVFISWMIFVTSEWVGMTWIWPDERTTHAKELYEQELSYLEGDFEDTLVGGQARSFARSFSDGFYEVVFEKTGFMKFILRLDRMDEATASDFFKTLRKIYINTQDYIIAGIYASQAFAVRLAVLIMAMPLFFLFAIAGLTDGLVQRDVRKWCGGRESSLVYSYAKSSVIPVLLVSWIVYLGIPISFHPNYVLLPFGLLFGAAIMLTAASFKKYI